MRNFMDLIESAMVAEADRPTKVKDPLAVDIDIEGPTSQGDLVSTDAHGSSFVHDPLSHDAPPADLPGRRATGAETRASIKPINDPRAAHMMGHLMGSGLEDEISDEEAAHNAGLTNDTDGHDEPTPENLPMVINNALTTDGFHIQPKWHMVKNLPGYMASAIRAMGRMVFAPFTNTPIEDIQVLSTLSNDDVEVKAMMTWIKRNGVKDDEAMLHFHEVLPNYAPNTQIWNVEGYTFMVVQDPFGYYVYGWPGGRGTKLGKDANDVALIGR